MSSILLLFCVDVDTLFRYVNGGGGVLFYLFFRYCITLSVFPKCISNQNKKLHKCTEIYPNYCYFKLFFLPYIYLFLRFFQFLFFIWFCTWFVKKKIERKKQWGWNLQALCRTESFREEPEVTAGAASLKKQTWRPNAGWTRWFLLKRATSC